MLHKLTALILTGLMLVVATTSQVGLHYCLCEKSVFVGDCPCATPVSDSVQELEPASCCDCCASEDTLVVVDTASGYDFLPCGDCVVSLDLKIGECVPQFGGDFKVSPAESLLNLSLTTRVDQHAFSVVLLQEIEIRGSPPSLVIAASAPIYLTFERFLI